MMKIIISQKYSSNSKNESEVLLIKEGSQEQFDKMTYWQAVEFFLGERLDNDRKVCVELIIDVEGEEIDLIDSKEFESPFILNAGNFVLIIPHQKNAKIIEIKEPISQSVFYGQHKLWDVHEAGFFMNKLELEQWVNAYVGPNAQEIKASFKNL